VKRLLLTLVMTVGLAAWVGAEDDSARRPSAVEQAALLHRNRELLETLVDGGLGLTQETAPLERAERCRLMAVKLKDEIASAAGKDERDRLAELAQHLRRLIEQGLTANLRQARQSIPPHSAEEKQLFELRDLTKALLQQVEDVLAPVEGEQIRATLASVRAQVEQAARP
jgi:hypothetical protein